MIFSCATFLNFRSHSLISWVEMQIFVRAFFFSRRPFCVQVQCLLIWLIGNGSIPLTQTTNIWIVYGEFYHFAVASMLFDFSIKLSFSDGCFRCHSRSAWTLQVINDRINVCFYWPLAISHTHFDLNISRIGCIPKWDSTYSMPKLMNWPTVTKVNDRFNSIKVNCGLVRSQLKRASVCYSATAC